MSEKHPDWNKGYAAGYRRQPMRAPKDCDAGEWTSGYLVGARSSENDELIDELEREFGGVKPWVRP